MLELNLDTFMQSKKEYIESVIEICKPIFNDEFGLDFSKNDCLKVAFCAFENRAIIYEDFCKHFFPLYLAEGYDREGSFTAQAFTNTDKDIYGILICLDVDQEPSAWYQIILHEMSHLFCITHEISRDNFTAKYLKSTEERSPDDHWIYIGYAIWREFIADYIAYQLNPIMRPLTLAMLRGVARELDEDINIDNPNRAEAASQMLAYIFVTSKIQKAADADTIHQTLKRNRVFASRERCELYHEIISLIFHQIRKDYFWEINPSFIKKIGQAYLWLPH